MSALPLVGLCIIASIVAVLLITPLLTTEKVPPSALLPTDVIEFEYAQQSISVVSGSAGGPMTLESRVLEIDGDGNVRLHVSNDSGTDSYESVVDGEMLRRLGALVKETGFFEITPLTFLPDERPEMYDLYTMSVSLNGLEKSVRWSTGGVLENFVPPILVMIQEELDSIGLELEQG